MPERYDAEAEIARILESVGINFSTITSCDVWEDKERVTRNSYLVAHCSLGSIVFHESDDRGEAHALFTVLREMIAAHKAITSSA